MLRLFQTALLTLMLAPSLGSAQDFQKGVAVVEAGDYATALQEWAPLAEQGVAGAQYNLGLMYDNGHGVLQDYAVAAKWYRLAAEQGEATAQSNLGVMYEKGQGVSQDYAEAVKWYRLAAGQGDTFAQTNLSAMYGKGQGVPQDYITAHMWLNIAASQGEEMAASHREVITKKMQPADISEAQRRARVCFASDYADCD